MDFNWHRIRKTEGEIIDGHLLPYVIKTFPKEIMAEAWDDFVLGEELPEEASALLYSNLFLPWFLVTWVPLEEDFSLQGKPIALKYLEAKPHKLSSYQQQFIQAICQTPYSFYVVLEVVPEKSLLLKDILLGTDYRVKEKNATFSVKSGNIMFTRVLTLEDQSICIGTSPYIIDAQYYPGLLDLRDGLEEVYGSPLTVQALREDFPWDVHEEWLSILEEILNPPLPVLRNTDGELIELCTIHFALMIPPEEAFRRLLPLTLEKDPSPFLEEATRDKQGDITKIQFCWSKRGNKMHKSWSNTTMGDITIQKKSLVISVNSKKREEKIKKLLATYLGNSISYKKTDYTAQKHLRQKSRQEAFDPENTSRDLKKLPEVQEAMKTMREAHWRDWFDQSIPVLNHQTLREAAKTVKGRERLEALLWDCEQRNGETTDPFLRVPLEDLRRELGLTSSRGFRHLC